MELTFSWGKEHFRKGISAGYFLLEDGVTSITVNTYYLAKGFFRKCFSLEIGLRSIIISQTQTLIGVNNI